MHIYIAHGDYGSNGEHITVFVSYDFYPYIPETGPTYSCGGQPAEGGYAEICKIVDENGVEIEIDEKAKELLEEEIYEDHSSGDYE